MSEPSPIEMLALTASSKFRDDYVELSRSIFHSEEARNKLYHSGEFGRYREQLVRGLLASFLPARLSIGDGFVLTPDGNRSTQCDVVLYDREQTPHIEAAGGRCFYPLETCAAVGEAKSDLTFGELKKALEKLMAVKRLRTTMRMSMYPVAPVDEVIALSNVLGQDASEGPAEYFRPLQLESHNLVTFLVCESIEWPAGQAPHDQDFGKALNDLYDSKNEPHLRHNFILSVEQGLLSYFYTTPDESNKEDFRRIPYPHPVQSLYRPKGVLDDIPTKCGWRWLPADGRNYHIFTLVSELAIAANAACIFQFTPRAYSLAPNGFDFKYFPCD